MFVLDPNPVKAAQFLCDAHVCVICREVTMPLSSWYSWNMSDMKPSLPYKPMNEWKPTSGPPNGLHPGPEVGIPVCRGVFDEFEFRFGKSHASRIRYYVLASLIERFDPGIVYGRPQVRFTFVVKGDGVFPGQTMSQTVRLYRLYYLSKLSKMKVPVIWTSRSGRIFETPVLNLILRKIQKVEKFLENRFDFF